MQLGTANLPTNRLIKLDVHCWKLLQPVVGPPPGMDWNQLCGTAGLFDNWNTMVPGHRLPMTARGERFKVEGVDSRFPMFSHVFPLEDSPAWLVSEEWNYHPLFQCLVQ